jgi:trans-2,3-dihydro-3-hydroxyanthranilate isomerase
LRQWGQDSDYQGPRRTGRVAHPRPCLAAAERTIGSDMATYDYCTCDVFTSQVFGGNPLAVVLDAAGLDAPTMQAIAREFNYSETTFVLPPTRPGCMARVRIFTPGGELPFAGHPTVGTAFVLATLGRIDRSVADIVFDEAVGPVPVRIDREPDGPVARCTLTAAQAPECLGALTQRAPLAQMLGLAPEALAGDAEIWSCGVPFLIVPLAEVGQLAAARLDLEHWRAQLRDADSQKVFIVARVDAARWRARMFAPGFGVPEDPATGSAAASMAGWLARNFRHDGEHEWQILQGQEIGRPSFITLAYEQSGDRANRVRVGGAAVLVARGSLTV